MSHLHPGFRTAVACLALVAGFAATSPARAAANHVVISEFATRGPTSASDEFAELYNPTSSAVNISGWTLRYEAASLGGGWANRAILPANSIIAAHGYFLIASQGYVGSVTPDFQSGDWGTGIADNGHLDILDASSIEVDRVGWGTALNPEGAPAPNHGTSANSNSVERKALASSTADSLAAGGAHAALGNGQDTNNNGVDFVFQSHGRNPQNTLSSIEPGFSFGGNGTGVARVLPTIVFANHSLDSLRFSFHQDSSYTVSSIAITVPSAWVWSHSTSSVVLAGPAFASAIPSIVSDTLFITLAALTTSDTGAVTIADLTTPLASGGSTFTVRTAVNAGTLTQLTQQPSVRVLDLVPISVVRVNNSSGVPTAPYGIGTEVTVTGIVTGSLSDVRTDIYLQDGSAGIDLFSSSLPPFALAPGDSLTVTGSILQFRGLTEVQPDFALLTRHATGRPVPEPLVITCAEVNATFKSDYTEPNESRLVRLNGVTYNATNSTITDATGTTNVFIPSTYPPAPAVFDLIGILKQYKPGTSDPGPPYTADYEVTPRTPDDIIAHPGPIVISTPYEDNIQYSSVQIHWLTDAASSSIVRYGTTAALGESTVVATPVTTHDVTVSGLTGATIYYYSVGSEDVNGKNFAPIQILSTASPPPATGAINVYFNQYVDPTLAWLHPANGDEDVVARLVTRINQARRSIDAALYSLSGTPGSSLATALINAKNRGVKVRVINEYDNSSTSAFSSLSSSGIPLINDRFDPVNFGLGLMHNKFFVIDSRGGAPESVWVWTGSWNPTDPGTNNDFQNSIELQDPALAGVYTLEFNEMWGSSTDVPNASASRFGARKLDDTPHHFVIGGRKVESYFSPSDGTTSHILSTINAAQHSIGFQMLTMTRTDLSAALVAKKNAGVTVRGDLDNGTDTGSQYTYLQTNGVDVKLKTGAPGLLHHKYMITDAESPQWDAVTLTGSHNWSGSAENSNNENTLIIHDFDIANQYLQEFSARYEQFGGTNPVIVGVEPLDSGVPNAVELSQNYPNPFRSATSILYAVPAASDVTLKLYDLQGREVQTLVNGHVGPGRYRVDLEAHRLSSGIYFYRLQTPAQTLTRKLVLLSER